MAQVQNYIWHYYDKSNRKTWLIQINIGLYLNTYLLKVVSIVFFC